ncbi:LamG-like jellyroll fold domain-containing protein [Dactylosporangium sp. AC04546]|uniref:LamG-like jellyroll fold domain-containing protein n=1 Tax=Dactylosporangium sp. AC04546 TaxID=2862460 RepID=UPI001EE0C3AC|nr:LamG-like jellyroll fold domain-containing protein [Dactylosporangium sp. AC04546]WVK83939.1 LamG-like jellyroll fold domain-containing protein [Dactylosporangium sp. AC04546]
MRLRLALCGGLAVLILVAVWIARRPDEEPPDVVTAEVSGSPHPVGSAGVGAAPLPSAARSSGVGGLRYAFDGGLDGTIADAGGRLPLRVRQAQGGALTAVPHDGGLAVRFPPRCEHYGAESCARAILQSGPADFLNPGRLPFSYGASILVNPSETSKGANVVQKGFSVGDSQFKLQVDGTAGRPSCVIVGNAGPAIHVALASRTVADGRWHRVACSRGDSLLTVAVDGAVVGRTTIPPSLSIANSDPLCIGGKGTSANNDQFVGVIDDVFVTRGA